jgi:hypothetical protein
MFLSNSVKGQNQFWRYLVSVIIVIIALFIGQIPLGILLFWAAVQGKNISGFEKEMDFETLGIDPNLGLATIILSFAAGLAALFLLVKFLHKKNFVDLITSHSKIQWSKIFYGFGLWFVLSIAGDLVFYFYYPENYVFNLNWPLFIPLVLVSFIMLPFQTSFEEIFLRGYLFQGFALIGVYRWVPLVFTSLIFGSLHWLNPEVESFGLGSMMVFYVGFGLFLGIITLLDDGLEIPLGIHAANNIYAAIIASYSGGALQTPALFKVTLSDKNLMLAGWLAMSVVFIGLAAKKYNWSDWRKIYSRI